MKESLQIFDRRSPVKVLGLNNRAVIWTQGCPHACKGCIVPESWDNAGGESVPIAELISWILTQPDIEGITFSGGEPMLQAEELNYLIDAIRAERDLGVVCYTGFRLEELQKSPIQKALLDRIDLLIDGRYVESLHADLLWRGSSNQRLLTLTDRYVKDLAFLLQQGDRSAGLEFSTDLDGNLSFTGVPALPNFRNTFEQKLRDRGIVIKT